MLVFREVVILIIIVFVTRHHVKTKSTTSLFDLGGSLTIYRQTYKLVASTFNRWKTLIYIKY